MAVNINIFMLTILFVPISFLSFPFVNQLTLVSGPPRPELNARPALLDEIRTSGDLHEKSFLRPSRIHQLKGNWAGKLLLAMNKIVVVLHYSRGRCA